jgi:hypothetical protein
MAGWLVRHRWWLAGLGLVSAVLVIGAWLAWPDPRPPEPARARQYRDFTACLLTDEHGILADPAKAIWAGMQSASLTTQVKVQYLAVVGEQTTDNAVPFLRSLTQGHCGLVFGAGPTASAAIRAVAGGSAGIRFFVTEGAASGNVALLDADRLTGDVESRIRSVVAASPSIR